VVMFMVGDSGSRVLAMYIHTC